MDKRDTHEGRLSGKIAVIVGGSGGIGKGIAEDFVKEGAYVAVADIAFDKAESIVEEINRRYGKGKAVAIYVDVTDEESVKRLVKRILEIFGEIDILIYSVGVVKAGSVRSFSLSDFKFVTDVNYTGYFLCVKHVSRVMVEQHKRDPSRIMDIIQINSKSGLQGSKRNFAYAGSKFGGIGLTQSFALELIEDGIKVNAVCPGNVFDGPLWSDLKNGLFVQYLKAGKIPGAKTIEDVRRYYESKIPMGRGCTVRDILTAIYYIIEQPYETGQAILVAGGQIMR
ncbi:TPA: SDR family NAD(P)-dependent oxidoreductase [Candidatus Bathyarchaeota archaeon]|nr:SDR family NAD(P)-dependent oxidoreductase [Candidatus Bathyarchaeota archaeon]